MHKAAIPVSIVGLGQVGRAFLSILVREETPFRPVLLGDSSGILLRPGAFSREELASVAGGKARGLRLAAMSIPGDLMDREAFREGFRASGAAIHVELGPTDALTGGPSLSRSIAALECGSSLVLSSKGPLVAGWDALEKAAGGNRVFISRCRFSATVGAGTPILDLGASLARGSPIELVEACLNGTSAFVLCRMEEGLSLEAALDEARAIGLAEADPSADIDGLDAAAKLCIISRYVLGLPLALDAVGRRSLRSLERGDFDAARAEGKRLRAVGRLLVEGGSSRAGLTLEALDRDSPLAGKGPEVGVVYHCSRTGLVSLRGPGAGPVETASAVLRDLWSLSGR